MHSLIFDVMKYVDEHVHVDRFLRLYALDEDVFEYTYKK